MILDTIFLHCGEIDRKPITDFNTGINKPDGLWLSSFDKEIGSDWLKYQFDEINEKYEYGYLIRLNLNTTIYLIKSLEDYCFLWKNFNRQEWKPKKFTKRNYCLDFNQIAFNFDGIYNLVVNLFIRVDNQRFGLFNGWDIASLVLFNHNCYNILKKINLNEFYGEEDD